MNKAIVVIGGGAGGMMAAICAARKGAHVTLLDPNERLGKKVNITGKGRCNVTNDCAPDEVLKNIPHNGRFLTSSVTRFPPASVKEFFTALGVKFKTERGNRVFPVSDRSFDISAALERLRRGRTCFLIAHRLATVRTADRILVLQDGRIAEQGTHQQLLDAGGIYWVLYDAQFS